MLRRAIVLLFALVCISAVSCDSAGKGKVILQGAGATFPAPLYKKWFAEYQAAHPNVKILYESIGSGGGVEMFTDGKVEFGASDAAMTDEQMKKVRGGGVLLLPMTGGSVVLAYNLPGFKGELYLPREAYSRIFLGEIKTWDELAKDKEFAKKNEDFAKKLEKLELSKNLKITVVHRAGASGTTFVFTQHLSAISEKWKKEHGEGGSLTVLWPEGFFAARGTDGVAEKIQQTPGAIGYLDFGYASKSDLKMATLENKEGEYIEPSVKSARAALESVELPENLRAFVPDPKGKESYPIVTFTWLLVHKTYDDSKRAAALKEFCKYALTDGQKECAELHYIPLPEPVAKRVLKAVDSIGP